jgi:pimeloyl-ACP methyl ester carboxylesterase
VLFITNFKSNSGNMYAIRLICTSLILTCFAATALAQQEISPFDTTMYGRNEAAGKYASIRGFKMYYEIYGQGEPLLLIHGNSGSINNFMYQVPYFASRYKVIIADSRAQGKSVENGDSLSYEMMADDLNALLDELKIDSCNVIGWSDGGINALLLAMRNPKKVKKLAVTGANLWPDSTAVDPFVYKWAMEANKKLAAAKETPENKNERRLTRLLSYEPHITTAQLHSIKCPTLVIGGDFDVILPQHTMLIAQHIPKAYLWILPSSGHSTPIVYKEQFNEVVGNFLATPYKKIQGFGRFN